MAIAGPSVPPSSCLAGPHVRAMFGDLIGLQPRHVEDVRQRVEAMAPLASRDNSSVSEAI